MKRLSSIESDHY